MNVLHITNCYPTQSSNDYGIFVKEQIDSLAKFLSVEVCYINAREYGVREYFKWPNAILIKNADVVHCHHVFSFYASLPWILLYRKKVVLSFLNQFENEIKLRIPAFLRVAICRFAVFFVDKYIVKADAAASNRKMVYMPNGVDVDKISLFDQLRYEKYRRRDKKYVIFFVSSKNPKRRQKRFDILESVVGVLRGEYGIDCEFVVASGMERNDYLRLLASSDLHLMCSDYEGSPNSVKEAMALNVPVVSRDVGNVRRMFSKIESPYYLISESSDPRFIAASVCEVLGRDPAKNTDGRRLIEMNELDMDSVSRKIRQLYFEICGKA